MEAAARCAIPVWPGMHRSSVDTGTQLPCSQFLKENIDAIPCGNSRGA